MAPPIAYGSGISPIAERVNGLIIDFSEFRDITELWEYKVRITISSQLSCPCSHAVYTSWRGFMADKAMKRGWGGVNVNTDVFFLVI